MKVRQFTDYAQFVTVFRFVKTGEGYVKGDRAVLAYDPQASDPNLIGHRHSPISRLISCCQVVVL
jgi:hypothetical protein